ncbi:putative transcription factor FAR family [Helianthus annuus]|uniref:Transcription factor FAR family n=1 Tax=Helianthus annuus TaxID=4232 RepID=A0A9K3HNS3_HELAN|nr:protein FAR1-RELATED SEQUENCE 5 isoform X2 [Helianthus annuus]XP_021993806.1 protein FAR1-RELATED SEQUENCE 5 isoform X2 [Helianthus annuus]XP_035835304.1 protein FAR1-RELATED SEQUENCE 5 isoform X2 [Helianthus annuus]KAF5781947.1 putative transcription factor FAR family [Helianthus annuus]KAJ0501491.1 putative transcription factor FAR family [Helianthus annuus]KAJ0517400.1 putative transcription factor FAR family [Helianthus annuus]KAJ0538756.1 putative transcription factor FAR family [Heli
MATVDTCVHDDSGSGTDNTDEVQNVDGVDVNVHKKRRVGIERISPRTGLPYYIPDVPLSSRPVIGMIFSSLEQACQFYENYAKLGGFTVRKNTQTTNRGVISLKYLVCSKEGHKIFRRINTLKDDKESGSKEKQIRRRPSIRTGCLAHLRLQICETNKYKVYSFVERHNHELVDADDYHLLSAARNLSYNKEQLIFDLSKLNIGPIKAFNIMRTHFGGFEEVGATKVDCKNFKRDINLFIGKHDAQMVINRLELKRDFLPDFSCEYFNLEEGVLGGLFWADQDMKRNYLVFGDVVSFDSTFRSNKYDMVFVPFTGIDNHHHNVTFAAALLANETADTYKWLLKVFKKVFGSAPRVVVTDQDAAMKKAIAEVFTTTRHRLCMWHIMMKVAGKVGKPLKKDKTFKQRICNIVWTDLIEPVEFETKWMEMISEFNLANNTWLSDMYSLKADWIPAYYRHEHMSGLMRTTSRSESENHFFGQVANSSLTLVEFLSHFETAMEAQRYAHRKNDHDTRNTVPEWLTEEDIEREADKIYTRNIFNDVQDEIYASVHKCTSKSYTEAGDFIKFFIKDLQFQGSGLFEVLFREKDMVLQCSCNRYEQYGLLCRHVFCVLRLCEITVFPKNYIMKRWTRDAVTNNSYQGFSNKPASNDNVEGVQGVVREIMFGNDYIVNRLVNNMEQLVIYRDQVKQQMIKVDECIGVPQPIPKKDRIANLLGFNQPTEDTIRAPVGIRTKGSGSKKRFKSFHEQASKKSIRKQRRCQICGSDDHDRRTCNRGNGENQPK